MPRHVAKFDLSTKTCPVCRRPFAWRKKWERCWDEVIYCSDHCRRAKGLPDHEAGAVEGSAGRPQKPPPAR